MFVTRTVSVAQNSWKIMPDRSRRVRPTADIKGNTSALAERKWKEDPVGTNYNTLHKHIYWTSNKATRYKLISTCKRINSGTDCRTSCITVRAMDRASVKMERKNLTCIILNSDNSNHAHSQDLSKGLQNGENLAASCRSFLIWHYGHLLLTFMILSPQIGTTFTHSHALSLSAGLSWVLLMLQHQAHSQNRPI